MALLVHSSRSPECRRQIESCLPDIVGLICTPGTDSGILESSLELLLALVSKSPRINEMATTEEVHNPSSPYNSSLFLLTSLILVLFLHLMSFPLSSHFQLISRLPAIHSRGNRPKFLVLQLLVRLNATGAVVPILTRLGGGPGAQCVSEMAGVVLEYVEKDVGDEDERDGAGLSQLGGGSSSSGGGGGRGGGREQQEVEVLKEVVPQFIS